MIDLNNVERNIGLWSLSFADNTLGFDTLYIVHGGEVPPTIECFEGVAGGSFSSQDRKFACIDKIDFDFSLPGGFASNASRAYGAALALVLFNKFLPNGDNEEVLPDLLCDLHHLADSLGVDFNEALNSADRHYAEETKEALGSAV